MMKSLYSGVSGLKTHNQRMDVIGNNISNVNTTAYKGSTVTFKDVFYQTKAQASAGSAISGGTNPTQVGYGVRLGTINQVMTQSGFTYSDSVFDCALEGEGFFQVMDSVGNIFYTRSGVFNVDNVGNLTDSNGYIVLGVNGDPTGVEASSQRISLNIPGVLNSTASATKSVTGGYEVTVSAASYGSQGNISLSIQHSDSPYATMSGSVLQVQMNLERDFASQEEFEDAVNAAIRAGGVNLDEGVIPLSIKFDSIPAETDAIKSSNIMEFLDYSDVDPDDEDAVPESLYLKFEVDQAGAFGNSYEINMKTSSNQSTVTAKWSNNVLTITMPGALDENGDAIMPTTEEIQEAIDKAAGMTDSDDDGELDGGNDKLRITVSCVDAYGEESTLGDWDWVGNLTNTKRVGLYGGADNFYRQAATDLGSIVLTDGRFEADQTVSDLDLIFIDDTGVIYGEHAVHGRLLLGRIDLVTFENPIGLDQAGTSYWRESLASGEARVKQAGEDGAANVVSGALEMSNVDLSQEFSDMIITQRGFQANSRIITVSDTMLEELINLKR